MTPPSPAKDLVLVVEDEQVLADGIEFNLVHEGFAVARAASGEAAEALLLEEGLAPDLVLLDVMLPGRDGFAVLERLRAAGAAVPVILVTSRAEDVDAIRGLELGADDYVTKPFSLGQLVARIRAVLRRHRGAVSAAGGAASDPGAPEAGGERIECPTATIDFARCAIRRDGQEHPLTATEVELLRLLRDAEGVLSRNALLDRLWGPGSYSTRTVDNHIARIRKKLEPDPAQPRSLVTVHGVGYRLLTR